MKEKTLRLSQNGYMESQLCARFYFLFRGLEWCKRMPLLIKSTFKTYSNSLNRQNGLIVTINYQPLLQHVLSIMETPFKMSVLIKINAFEHLYFIHIVRIHDG